MSMNSLLNMLVVVGMYICRSQRLTRTSCVVCWHYFTHAVSWWCYVRPTSHQLPVPVCSSRLIAPTYRQSEWMNWVMALSTCLLCTTAGQRVDGLNCISSSIILNIISYSYAGYVLLPVTAFTYLSSCWSLRQVTL